MREFEILFAKATAERVYTWAKGDEVVEIFKIWKWYGGTLRVNDQKFDIDVVRENKNSEWQNFEFEEGEDFYDVEYQVDSSDDAHEEILESADDYDEGFEALCDALEEAGYTLQKEELVVEKAPLAELSEM